MEITPQVKDLTEVVQTLPSLMDAILSLLATPWGAVTLIAFLFWLLINKNLAPVHKLFGRKHRQRLGHIAEYLSLPDAQDENTAKAVRDQRDSLYFKEATNIYAEGRHRNALIGLHQATSHAITWAQIRRARPYICVALDESISIRDLTFGEKAAQWYNMATGFVMLLFSAGIASLVFLGGQKHPLVFFASIGGSIFAALIGMLILSQNWPIKDRQQIKDELQRISKSASS